MTKIIQKTVDEYCAQRPGRITNWLETEKFISREVLDKYRIGYNGKAITIPVKTKNGEYFFKFRANPFGSKQTLRYWCSKDAKHDLYPRDVLENDIECLYLVEGELKALSLISLGYPAICGTGGANTLKESWIEEIKSKVNKVIILFDEDSAGQEGAKKCALKFQ